MPAGQRYSRPVEPSGVPATPRLLPAAALIFALAIGNGPPALGQAAQVAADQIFGSALMTDPPPRRTSGRPGRGLVGSPGRRDTARPSKQRFEGAEAEQHVGAIGRVAH